MDNWGKGEGLSRNMYKGSMDKAKGWEVGVGGARERGGGKMETTVLEQQFGESILWIISCFL